MALKLMMLKKITDRCARTKKEALLLEKKNSANGAVSHSIVETFPYNLPNRTVPILNPEVDNLI